MHLDLPATIDLGDERLRWFTDDDVPALAMAMADSFDHLHPWMSWATPEGTTPEACARFISGAAERRRAGTDFEYGIYAASDSAAGAPVLGACGLHERGEPGVLEIGYWLHVNATGRGIMTRVARALTNVAFTHPDVHRVEIHVDEGNQASAAVPRRLGFVLDSVGPSIRLGGAASTGRHQYWATER